VEMEFIGVCQSWRPKLRRKPSRIGRGEEEVVLYLCMGEKKQGGASGENPTNSTEEEQPDGGSGGGGAEKSQGKTRIVFGGSKRFVG